MYQHFVMFPGQGSQFVGMGKTIADHYPVAKETFEEADDALGWNLSEIIFSGPDSKLNLTPYTQPAILTASIASWRIIKDKFNSEECIFAGHSLGEYSALVAAEKLDFALALRTVHQRGKCMQDAVPEGIGAMAAIVGANYQSIQEICSNYSTLEKTVEIANFNSLSQVVISGHKEGVVEITNILKNELKARCIILPVSAPFHCSLMNPAKVAMQKTLSELKIHFNENAIIANLDANLYKKDYNSQLLIEQIDHSVLWTNSLQYAEKLGIYRYYEVGPNKVLAGLAKKTLANTATMTIQNIFDIMDIEHLKTN